MLQVVHGLSIPLGKLGFYLPRTISRGVLSISNEGPDAALAFRVSTRVSSFGNTRRSGADSSDGPETGGLAGPSRAVFRIGGTIIPRRQDEAGGKLPDRREGLDVSTNSSSAAVATTQPTPPDEMSAPYRGRTIRFPDEAPSVSAQTPVSAASPER